MAELKLRSKDPDSLRRIIQSALSERLQSVTAGIKRTEERIQEFETKYNLSTEEFIIIAVVCVVNLFTPTCQTDHTFAVSSLVCYR
jgi:hypothetical protein